MTRRRSSESAESTFGSDSFLDVIANIVGILIILIVIVGIRIKYASPASVQQQEQLVAQQKSQWEKEKEAIEQANRSAQETHQKKIADLARQRQEQQEATARYQAALADKQEKEKLHETERLRREKILSAYEQEANLLQAEMEKLGRQLQIARAKRTAQEQEATDRLTSLDANLKFQEDRERSLSGQLAQTQASVSASKKDSQDLLRQVEQLRRKLAEVTQKMPPTQPLKHYATPMARIVRKKHAFFYCKGGRITYTFFDELMNQASEQVRGRMSPSSSRIEGSVGPIGSFRLKYVFSRIGISMSEQLAGPVAISYQASQIVLKPDEEPIGETIDQALLPNSSFRLRMRSLMADKQAITLWVYGDSFALANQIEEFCHDAGFDVVLMPLPEGQLVTLGPNGFSMDAR
jgi:uncharacterized coiled-coil protein SlyX